MLQKIMLLVGLPLAVLTGFVLLNMWLATPASQGLMRAGAKDPNPLRGKELYVFPNNYAHDAMVTERDPAAAELIRKIADRPVATWYGQWNKDLSAEVQADIADASKNDLPVLVMYNIPHRDCGQYSAGGAGTAEQYRQWVDRFVSGVGNKPAIVIVEPDALGQVDCLKPELIQERYGLLKYAIEKLKTETKSVVYVDAGNARWGSAETMAERLELAGLEKADGFSVNVSNYYSNEESLAYAQRVSQLRGGKHFVIDTSRNGNGPLAEGAWCNPAGRALGTPPQIASGVNGLDAYLWVKRPGTSDGTCNGGPAAGLWWRQNALELAKNAR